MENEILSSLWIKHKWWTQLKHAVCSRFKRDVWNFIYSSQSGIGSKFSSTCSKASTLSSFWSHSESDINSLIFGFCTVKYHELYFMNRRWRSSNAVSIQQAGGGFSTQFPNLPPSVGGCGRSYIINSRDSESLIIHKVLSEVTHRDD